MTETLNTTPVEQTQEQAPQRPDDNPNIPIPINQNLDKSVFTQLEEEAIAAGRPDMVGIEWRDQDGKLCRISHYEALRREKNQVHDSRLRRPVWRRHLKQGPAIEHKLLIKGETETVDYWTVDVYDDKGDLVEVKPLTRTRINLGKAGEKAEQDNNEEILSIDKYVELRNKLIPAKPKKEDKHKYTEKNELADYFIVEAWEHPDTWNDNANAKGADKKMHRKIKDVQWNKYLRNPELPEKFKDVDVPLIKDRVSHKDKVSLQAIAMQQERLGLEGWVGLTWTDSSGQKKKVTRDVVVMKKDPDTRQEYPERVYEVITCGPDGKKTRDCDLYPALRLEKYLTSVGDRASRLQLHWEIPDPEAPTHPLAKSHWQEEQAWGAWEPREDWAEALWNSPAWAHLSDNEKSDKLLAMGSNLEPGSQEAQGSTDITKDKALSLLTGPEGISDEVMFVAVKSLRGRDTSKYPEEIRAAVKEIGFVQFVESLPEEERSETVSRYVDEVRAAVKEIGIIRFMEMAEALHKQHKADLQRLGIESNPTEETVTFPIIKLIEAKLAGEEDTFRDNKEGRAIRRKQAAFWLGDRFRASAIKLEKKPTRGWKVTKDATGAAREEAIETSMVTFSEDQDYKYRGKIRTFLYRQNIEAMLAARHSMEDIEKLVKEGELDGKEIQRNQNLLPLTKDETEKLGVYLKRSLGSNYRATA